MFMNKVGICHSISRISDWEEFHNIKTHMGHVFKVGDRVIGYDLKSMNCFDEEIEFK